MSVTRSWLKEMFLSSGAFKVASPGKPFILASGRESDYYVDCRKLLLQPRGNFYVTHAMRGLITSFMTEKGDPSGSVCIGTTGVGGAPLLGGILFSMGDTNKHSGFVVRESPKGHGLRQMIEGHIDKDGAIVLIDDVLTTGGSIKHAADVLFEDYRRKPEAIMVLVDREEGGAEELTKKLGCPVRSVFKVSELRIEHPVATV